MASSYSKATLTGGGFSDASGNPLNNGYLLLTLSHDENISTLGSPTGIQIVAGIQVKIFLDGIGNIVANQSVWTNDVLTPSGSYYTVVAYNNSGLQVWANPQILYIQPYEPTINFGTLTPQTP